MSLVLRIGTRRSELALWQAEYVKRTLETLNPGLECRLVKIVTKGDKMRNVPLAAIGGKGLFIKEIEEALSRGEIDVAVHSLKDVPSELPPGLCLAALPPREDPRDALLAKEPHAALETLRSGARIGTSSLRRAVQLKRLRADFEIVPVRGNVGTRIKRLDAGELDALVLAYAGVKRLGQTSRISQILDPEICLPAVGQGALALEARQDDRTVQSLLEPLDDRATAISVGAERAFLYGLGGGCQVPIAGLGRLSGDTLRLSGLVASLDGQDYIRREIEGPAASAAELGSRLAREILSAGGEAILSVFYEKQ
jgi:hydroxymethylbilane synthase